MTDDRLPMTAIRQPNGKRPTTNDQRFSLNLQHSNKEYEPEKNSNHFYKR